MDSLKNKNILIAGGAGFIGTNLVKRLAAHDCHVRATVHVRAPQIDGSHVHYQQCDLLSKEDCAEAVRDMDMVFMCAANTSGAAVIKKSPLAHVTPNIIMNAQLLEEAYLAGVKKFVFISSNAAYPPTGDRPTEEHEMFAADPYPAYYPVGWMKRYTEILCQMYAEKLNPTMQTVVLRPSNIYGPHDDFNYETSHVTAALVRRVVERGTPFTVWGTGDDVRDILYVDDFIEATLLAATRLDTFSPINIAFGQGFSIKNILNMLLKIDGFDAPDIHYDASKPSMIPVRLLSTRKAEQLLNFTPQISVEEGLERTLSWFRNHVHTPSATSSLSYTK